MTISLPIQCRERGVQAQHRTVGHCSFALCRDEPGESYEFSKLVNVAWQRNGLHWLESSRVKRESSTIDPISTVVQLSPEWNSDMASRERLWFKFPRINKCCRFKSSTFGFVVGIVGAVQLIIQIA
jgi:hypothetical protein